MTTDLIFSPDAQKLQEDRTHSGEKNVADLTQQFLDLLPPNSQPNKKGFVNFACPCCMRNSGFVVSQRGGFRFHCFNTHCDYHRATGWEPGSVIGDRTRQLFQSMGGDPAQLRHKPKYLPGTFDRIEDVIRELDIIHAAAERDAHSQQIVAEDNE